MMGSPPRFPRCPMCPASKLLALAAAGLTALGIMSIASMTILDFAGRQGPPVLPAIVTGCVVALATMLSDLARRFRAGKPPTNGVSKSDSSNGTAS